MTIVILSDSPRSDLLKRMFCTINVDSTYTIDPLNEIDDPLFISYNWLANKLMDKYTMYIGVINRNRAQWCINMMLKVYPRGLIIGTIKIDHMIGNRDYDGHMTYYETTSEFEFQPDKVLVTSLSDDAATMLCCDDDMTSDDICEYMEDYETITIKGGWYIDNPYTMAVFNKN